MQLSTKCTRFINTLIGHQNSQVLSSRSRLHVRRARRAIYTSSARYGKLFAPPSSDVLPRPAGVASMYRLPVVESTQDLDVCFVGVPIDIGTTNRPGTRFGPRQIREMSVHVGPYNPATGADPYRSLRVADAGDVFINQYDLPKALTGIRDSFLGLTASGCRTAAIGGDHSITYPILQAVKERHGPVGLIHVDAHDDTVDTMGGEPLSHASPFRRAGEDGCLDFSRVVQIGLRGSGYGPDDYEYGREKGFRMVRAEDCWHKSLAPLMAEVRGQMGDGPVYISFDIDGLDPAYAPGTGTPEIGGLSVIQALEILRGCRGLNVVGCDLVEVSPPYDPQGTTSLVAANLLFEMLCVFPGVTYTT